MANNSSVAKMFKAMGYNYKEMTWNLPHDVSTQGFEVLSYNPATKQDEWCGVKHIVRKNESIVYNVKAGKNKLICSPEHRIAITSLNKDKITWMSVKNLLKVKEDKYTLIEGGKLAKVSVTKTDKQQDILDFEVEGTNCYYSNGILSHNSMYGLDKDTVGGLAWKYAASVRIWMRKGKKIEAAGNKEKIIGIGGRLTVEKNRICPPFKSAHFEIFFDHGINPVSGFFDVLVDQGVITSPSQGWYEYAGEKFREKEFSDVLKKHKELLGTLEVDLDKAFPAGIATDLGDEEGKNEADD